MCEIIPVLFVFISKTHEYVFVKCSFGMKVNYLNYIFALNKCDPVREKFEQADGKDELKGKEIFCILLTSCLITINIT